MKTLKTPFFLLTLLSLTFVACKEDPIDPSTDDADYLTAQVAATTQSEFDEVFQIADEAMQEAGLYGKTSTLCAAISLDSAANLVTVDFGTGCAGPDGRQRAGIIKINYVGRDRVPGNQMTITLENYEVAGYKLSGILAVSILSRNPQGQLVFSYEVSDGELTYLDGATVTYASTRSLTWAVGEGTGDPSDDVFLIDGSSSGTNKTGDAYSSQITQSLEIKTDCLSQGIAMPASGVVTVSTSLLPASMNIDFGTGTCDTEATVTYRAKSKVIDVRG